MATAKRVAQDNKPSVVSHIEKHEMAVVTTVDGVVTNRTILAEGENETTKTIYEPQPDRLALDLSLEEARAIQMSLNYSTNSKARGIRQAVTVALREPSSTAGTPASPKMDGGCGVSPQDYYKGYSEPSSLGR